MPSRRLLALLLCIAVLVAAPGPTTAAAQSATFADDVSTDAVGDVAELTVRLNGTDTATLSVEGSSHDATLSPIDRDGDGTVTVRVNTHLRGTDAYSVAGNDTLSTTTASGGFEAGDYDLTLGGDEPSDVGTLVLTSADAHDMSLFRAPIGSFHGLDSQADLRSDDVTRATNLGALTDTHGDVATLVSNETLVVRLEVAGLEGRLAAKNGTAREQLRAVVRESPVNLTAVQTNPTPQRDAMAMNLLGADSSQVVTDAANDTYYVVVDTEHAPITYDHNHNGRADDGDAPHRRWLDGERFHVNFSLDGPVERYPDSDSASPTAATFELVDPTVSFEATTEDGTYELPPTVNATVRGDTTLAPGTRLTVVVRGNDSVTRTTATVFERDNRSQFAVSTDLSNSTVGERLSLRVRFDETRIGAVDAVVVDQSSETTTPSVTSTTTPTATAETTETTETTRQATTTVHSTTQPTRTTSPGFGLVVALLALVCAALLARR